MVGSRAKSSSVEKAFKGRPSLAVVGLGNVGSTLGWALHAAGFPVVEMVVRRSPTSEQRALAKDCGARLIPWKDWQNSAAEVVWICVRDDEIAPVAEEIARRFRDAETSPRIYLHSSAPRSFREMNALKQTGAAIGAVHPVRSFPTPQRVSLEGAYFAIEGDPQATKAASMLAKHMHALPFGLRTQDKALYHAFCVLSSPLMVAHLAATEDLGVAAGIPKAVARRLLASLAGGTFANWQRKGPAASFSGPISRGDIETIALHLASLSSMPETDAIYPIYQSLSRYAVAHLPARKRAQLAALLGAPPRKRKGTTAR